VNLLTIPLRARVRGEGKVDGQGCVGRCCELQAPGFFTDLAEKSGAGIGVDKPEFAVVSPD